MTDEFAALLRQLRAEAELSQNALARAAGINPTNLNRIERGKQGTPRPATVLKLVRALGLSLADERAQQLLGLAGVGAVGSRATEPGGVPASALPAIRELRRTLLHALDLLAQLEALAGETEDE